MAEEKKLIRCFIALELPREAINYIEELQGLLKKKNLFYGKFTEAENLHLTLKFLGEISDEKAEEVKKKLAEIKFKEFEASLGEIGTFINKYNSILWIKLNGKDLGVLWTAPWQIEITTDLKKKDNHLEVEVANLWINRLIGDESQPWDGVTDGKWPEWLINGTKRPTKRFTFTPNHFYKTGDPLAESGLMGPVSIKVIGKR